MDRQEDVIYFSNILTSEQNSVLLQLLRETSGWEIGYDQRGSDCNIIDDPMYPGVSEGKHCYTSDAGFLLKTYDDNKPVRLEESYAELNGFAKFIMNICIDRASKAGYNYPNLKLWRIFWNYYSSASYGSLHVDSDLENFTSIVYYLNSTGPDYGTRVNIIGDKEYFYESKEGNSIMFPSNTLHGGTGAPHHKQRWCLNIMFESDFEKMF